jgi:RHS repeat-associated protein
VVEVKDQSGGDGATDAEYYYNGLGHRVHFLQDTDSDGDADAFDFTFYLAYEDWRVVATFRHTDTSPKEQFLNHNAGLGGFGGAHGGIGGYIDHVVMRDRDANTAWTTASDGTLEERRYHCQNWRADVSAVVTSAGKLVEAIKNSSYGIPTGIPGGDTDSDGDWDATDSAAVTSGSYEIRKDPELDNDADAADVTFANSIKSGYQTLGRGVLSSTAVGNRKGYAGYENDIYLTVLDHVRWRVYNKVHGRWTRRDPAGYVDGANLFAYCNTNVISHIDPFGLISFGYICCRQLGDLNKPSTGPIGHCYFKCGSGPNERACSANPVGLWEDRWPEGTPGHPNTQPQCPGWTIFDGAWGPIDTYCGPFRPGHPDYGTNQSCTPVHEYTGTLCECVENVMKSIEDCCLGYELLGPNSNSVIYTALKQCLGQEPPSPKGTPPIGWGDDICQRRPSCCPVASF